MNNSNSGFMGMFGVGGSRDPSLNVPLTSNALTSHLSPYLSVDPAYLQTQPEFISLDGARPRRGRFEMSIGQTGSVVMVGFGIGGVHGLYKGLLETTAAGHVGHIRRTQVINYMTKRASGTSNTLGIIAVMYSALGCFFYWGRGRKEDSANTLLAGSLTGALYQSSNGLRKAGIGGAVGLAVAGMFVACLSKDQIKEQYGYN